MTLQEQLKLAKEIMRILKVDGVAFPIARTPKGDLSAVYHQTKEEMFVTLDSVPLNEKEYDNRELKSILIKYLYGPNID